MTLTKEVLLVLLAVLAGVAVVLALVIWSIKRHRNPRLSIDTPLALPRLAPSMAGLSQGGLIEGNAVELYENGAFFDAMFDSIASARHSVHFETFLWKDGQLGRRLTDALIERQRAGVQVRVIVDAKGGELMGHDAQRRLCDGGCRFTRHHAAHLRHIGVYNERDHRKLLVVDGRVAMLGGHCIVDDWLGDAQDRKHFRDIGVRVRGPAVHALQSVFSENWVGDTGEMFVGDGVFPRLEPAGDVALHVASVKCEGSPSAVKLLHHLALCVARERLWIQNPYFLPDAEAIEALGQAVSRGVDVRVMVPSTDASDMPLVQHAAHHNFARLLASGVRMFEYTRTLLHQKVMTLDGAWCAIGSCNFDDRSFEVNDELTIGVCDAALARQLEAIFLRDMQHCVEINARQWESARGWSRRAKDSALFALNELL